MSKSVIISFAKRLGYLLKSNRQVHLKVSKQITKYLILSILSKSHRVFYVVHPDHVIHIFRLFSSLKKLFTKSIGYWVGDSKRNYKSNLIVLSEDKLLEQMEESDEYIFANVVVMDEGLEKTEMGHLIEVLWENTKKRSFKFIHLTSDRSSQEVKVLDKYTPTVTIKYQNENLRGDALVESISELVKRRYVDLTHGCCIVVFVPNYEYAVELKSHLFQIQDFVIVTFKEDFESIVNVLDEGKPKIIITNNTSDINSLSNVSLVIDSMLEEHNHLVRYISKHQAEKRCKRVTFSSGFCYRMLTMEKYNRLASYHIHNLFNFDNLMLWLLMNVKGVRSEGLADMLNVDQGRIADKLNYFSKHNLYDPGRGVLRLGVVSSKMRLKSKSFKFLNNWNSDGLSLFPAILVAGLMEYGDHHYFKLPGKSYRGNHAHIDKNFSYYIGKNDVETFLNIYHDLLNYYRGFPKLEDKNSIMAVKEWAKQRKLDAESIISLTKIIRNIISDALKQNYEVKIGTFDVEKVGDLIKDYVVKTHSLVKWDERKKDYFGVEDESDIRYVFDTHTFHTLKRDKPNQIVVLEYEVVKERLRLIKLAINNEKIVVVKKHINLIDMDEILENMSVGNVILSSITLDDYVNSVDGVDRLDIQKKNAKVMNSRYKEWFVSTPPFYGFSIDSDQDSGQVYTKEETKEIKKKVKYGSELTGNRIPLREVNQKLDVTVRWPERGKTLVKCEFLSNKKPKKVIIVGEKSGGDESGKINSVDSLDDLEYLSSEYPDVDFYVYSGGFVHTGDNVYFVDEKVDQENVLPHLGAHLIITTSKESEQKRLISMLKPKSAIMFVDVLGSLGISSKNFELFEGVWLTIPYQKDSVALVTEGVETKKYKTIELKERLFYHNLITRQHKTFFGAIRNEHHETPGESDDLAIDQCYDCRREVEVLSGKGGVNDPKRVREKVNFLSRVISKNQQRLYEYPHGTYPTLEMEEKRRKLG